MAFIIGDIQRSAESNAIAITIPEQPGGQSPTAYSQSYPYPKSSNTQGQDWN